MGEARPGLRLTSLSGFALGKSAGRLLLIALLCLASIAATAAPRIGVITMQPGEIFFERFGHDAIVVMDTQTGEATSYNFGFFNMEEPGFVDRFAHGDMQ